MDKTDSANQNLRAGCFPYGNEIRYVPSISLIHKMRLSTNNTDTDTIFSYIYLMIFHNQNLNNCSSISYGLFSLPYALILLLHKMPVLPLQTSHEILSVHSFNYPFYLPVIDFKRLQMPTISSLFRYGYIGRLNTLLLSSKAFSTSVSAYPR